MNKHCSLAVTGQTQSKCMLSEEIISRFHLITEVQSQVQTPDLAERSSALGDLSECSSQATRQTHRQLHAGGWLTSAASAPGSGPNLQQLIQKTLAPGTGLAVKDYPRVTTLRSSGRRSTCTCGLSPAENEWPFGPRFHRRRWLNVRSLLGVEEVDHLIMLIHRLLRRRIPSETGNKQKPRDRWGLKEKLPVSGDGGSRLDKTLKNGIDPGLTINPRQGGGCPPGTPYRTAAFPGHQQNIRPGEFIGSLTQTHGNTCHWSTDPWTQVDSGKPPLISQRLAAAHSIFVAVFFMSSSTAQVKRHHSSRVAFVLSVQTTAKGCPKRCLKQPHYFERGRENCPDVELQKLLALAPRPKQEAEGLQFTGN